MNKWIKKVVALSFVATQLLVVPNVSASSLEEIQNQKNTVEEQVTQLQREVGVGLEEVSEISIALEDLNREIEEHQQTITETEKDIEAQEILVTERYEYTAEQLQAMQKNEVNNNIVLSIMQAESLTDLVNKVYSASVLTSASEDRLAEAEKEHEILNDMRETLVAEKEALDSKQVEVAEQKEALDAKVADLQSTLAANEEELEQLNAKEEAMVKAIAEREAAQKRAEEERVAAEEKAAERKVAAETSEEEKVKPATAVVASAEKPAESKPAEKKETESKPVESKPAERKPEPAAESNDSAGEWMTFQATGYSTQQPGLSTHTRTGIDLRVNPRVIAVDPSVIPLGSMVEVKGLGVYVAGDTGSAINGRIIDIHYPTVSQALSWGRRSVQIRVLN